MNSEGVAFSCIGHLCFGGEGKVKFIRGEMMFHRLKIRSEAMSAAQVSQDTLVNTRRAIQKA